MGRRRKGARCLGPYQRGASWFLVVVGGDGARRDLAFGSEDEAALWALEYTHTVVSSNTTVGEALTAYEAYMVGTKGNKQRSADTTLARLRTVLPEDDVVLSSITPRWAKRRYAAYSTSGVSVDTHRNVLAECKTFGRWLSERQGWLRADPFAGIKGEGKRSYGKAQLRGDEWRTLVAYLLPLAGSGSDGATAVLCAAMLGLRAGEVVGLVARDIDDNGATLWVAESKTRAGRRRVQVPDVLRPLLLAAAKGRRHDQPLLGEHWRDWPNEVLRRTLVELRLPVVTLHGLRGTLATLAYEAGAAGVIVAATLGHEDQRTTERSYATRGVPAEATRARGLSVVRGGRK